MNDNNKIIIKTPAELAEYLGVSQRRIYQYLHIPARTWENWAMGKCDPPEWAWLLILHAFGLYKYTDNPKKPQQ